MTTHLEGIVYPVARQQELLDIAERYLPGAPGLTTSEIRDLVTRRWEEYGIGQNPGETW